MDGVHGHDLSSLLNDDGVAVRAGDHCTQSLHNRLDISESVHASFYIYNTKPEVDALLTALEIPRRRLDDVIASDRFHNRFFEHYRALRNEDPFPEATFTKHSAETSCGDEGEFFIRIADDGTIMDIAFESESCAVSTAVTSMLSEALCGESIDRAIEAEGLVDGQYPDTRRDCVRGPEEVIVAGTREYLAEVESTSAA